MRRMIEKITYIVLRLAIVISVLAGIGIIMNFLFSGNNSHNSGNLRTAALWLAIAGCTFLVRKVFVRQTR